MVPAIPTPTKDGSASVVNPVPVSYWLLKEFTAPLSFTSVVTLILYVVEKDKLEEGVTVNVLLSLDADGEADICTQVLKLSEETWTVPEQLVSEVLIVTEALSIPSEKATEMDESMDTVVSESAGEVEETVGAVATQVTTQQFGNGQGDVPMIQGMHDFPDLFPEQ